MEKALAKFGEMKDKELKKELESRDLSTKGKRDDYMERLTGAVKKEAKKAVKKQLAQQDKKEAEEDKKLSSMSKGHLKRVLEKKELATKGSKEQLIIRIKGAGIDVDKVVDADEAAEIAKEEKAKAEAKAHLAKIGGEYADMKAPALRAELEKRKLSTKGKKAALMERLAEAAEKEWNDAQAEAEKGAAAEHAEAAAVERLEKERFDKLVAKFDDMTDKELKKELETRDLSTKGKRKDYIERLNEACKQEAHDAVKAKQEKLKARGTSLAAQHAAIEAAEKEHY